MDKENIALAPGSAATAAGSPTRAAATKSGVLPSPRAQALLISGGFKFPSATKPDEADRDQDSDATAPGTYSRRAALIYPSSALAEKSNQKPFSRSAAKRDSVMALGSIGYLQHLYAKQGIASKTRPLTKGALTLAIGRAGESMLSSTSESPLQSPTLSKAKLDRTGSGGQALPEDQLVLITSPENETMELPPSPKAPTSTRLPYPEVPKPVEADPEALWPVLLVDLDTTCQLWGLFNLVKLDKSSTGGRRLSIDPSSRRPSSRSSMHSADGQEEASDAGPIDLLELMNTTTKTIRSVRNYLLALPPASLSGKRLLKEAPGSKPKDQFKRQSSFGSLSRRSSLSPLPLEKTYGSLSRRVSSPQGASPSPSTRTMPSAWHATGAISTPLASPFDADDSGEDPLTLVRRSALEVLSSLRELEEKHRLPPDHPDYEKARAEASEVDGGGSILGVTLEPQGSKKQSATSTRGLTSLANPSTMDLGLGEAPDRGGSSGDGYLYRTDLKLANLDKERESVSNYLATVDRVLSVVQKPKQSKRPSKQRTVPAAKTSISAAAAGPDITVEEVEVSGSTDAAEEADSPDATPAWARKGDFAGGEVARIRAFLLAHLPAEAGFELLQVSTKVTEADNLLDISKGQLLSALVDGTMLCHAYNAALRQSCRPWGFIQPKEIHDLKAVEAEALDKHRMLAKEAEAGTQPFQVKDKDDRKRREASSGDVRSDAGDTTAPDTTAAAVKLRPGWTFRRAENLRVWAAALRLRYHIQTTSMSSLEPLSKPLLPGFTPPAKLGLHPRRVYSETSAAAGASLSSLSLTSTSTTESTKATTTTSNSGASGRGGVSKHVAGTSGGGGEKEAIEFDPRKVARKEEGWEEMLYDLVLHWVRAVASEERGEDAR